MSQDDIVFRILIFIVCLLWRSHVKPQQVVADRLLFRAGFRIDSLFFRAGFLADSSLFQTGIRTIAPLGVDGVEGLTFSKKGTSFSLKSLI